MLTTLIPVITITIQLFYAEFPRTRTLFYVSFYDTHTLSIYLRSYFLSIATLIPLTHLHGYT